MSDSKTLGNTIKYEEFIKLPNGAISLGFLTDSPDGINIDNSGMLLFYVVVKYSNQDWAVFCYRQESLKGMYMEDKIQLTIDNGIKVQTSRYIKRVFNCSKKVMDLYTS